MAHEPQGSPNPSEDPRKVNHQLRQEAAMLFRLGVVMFDRRQYESARRVYARALALCDSHPDSHFAAKAHANLGGALAGLGRLEEALEHLERAEAAATSMSPSDRASIQNLRAHVALWAGNREEACATLERLHRTGTEMGNQEVQVDVLCRLAEITLRSGDTWKADGYLQEAAEALKGNPQTRAWTRIQELVLESGRHTKRAGPKRPEPFPIGPWPEAFRKGQA